MEWLQIQVAYASGSLKIAAQVPLPGEACSLASKLPPAPAAHAPLPPHTPAPSAAPHPPSGQAAHPS